MKRLSSTKFLAVAIACVGFAAAGAAHARSDVVVTFGVQAPYGYGYAQPVYVQPQPVYVQPQPVYVQPGYGYGHDRGHRHHRQHRRGPWGDADRDGVPNRYDHAPHNPYRY